LFIDRVVKWLLPRENRFFVYLNSVASNVGKAGEIFAELRTAAGPADFARISDTLRQKEHEGDELAHILFEEVDKTFVTPIDREDLHALTSALDDVLDMLYDCAQQIVSYKLQKMTDPMRDLVRVAQEASGELAKCIPLLQDLSRVEELQVLIIRVNALENEGGRIYRRATEQLFERASDAIELFREKQILDALEGSIDACEDVMDLMRSVVAKNG
jgi:hypothetical protein